MGEEPLVQFPLDAQHPPLRKEGDLRLGILGGHVTVVKDNVDLVFIPLDIGIHGVTEDLTWIRTVSGSRSTSI